MSGRGAEVFRPPQWHDAPDAPLEKFDPVFAASLDGQVPAPREWTVDGLFMRGTVGIIGGPPKAGKSLLLQQLLSAVALGREWLGRATISGRCFGLFCEDAPGELMRRQAVINAHYAVDAPDYETGLSWEGRDTKDGTLVEFEKFSDKPVFTDLWHQVWRHVEENGIDGVGLDPTAVIFGGNENFKRQVTVFLREVQKKASRMNGFVLLNTHPSKNDQTNLAGSIAWHGAVRMGAVLHRPPEYDPLKDEPRDVRIFRSLGGNYSVGRPVQTLRITGGVFVVDEPEKSPGMELFTSEELKYRLISGMCRVIKNGGYVYADEMHAQSMPSRARRSGDATLARTPLNALYSSQEMLLHDGKVRRVKVRGKCLLRPEDGPGYEEEEEWVI